MRNLTILLAVCTLAACNKDTDGDGLTDKEEADLGSNPELVDTDGDGLDDFEEVMTYFTSPISTDTDGDGYLDNWEIDEGSDPTDAVSGIYEGGWPYNPDKADLGDPSIASSTAAVGQQLARFRFSDQFGETVDIYDFAGKPMIIDISAEWCGPCKNMSAWLSGMNESWTGAAANVRDMVDSGELHWVTVMGQDNYGEPPAVEVLENWETAYPHDKIPVLGDDGTFYPKYLIYGWPSLYLIGADMKISEMPDGTDTGHWDAIYSANAL